MFGWFFQNVRCYSFSEIVCHRVCIDVSRQVIAIFSDVGIVLQIAGIFPLYYLFDVVSVLN
ncbi:hypothetical protein AB833_07760 [Chromatiales bacterium (ex Bugula neritina AB1)]|nr:hypothetical protein AB833_07760 [Chromatiales bacterium (ex Bugula neritina AB1)]